MRYNTSIMKKTYFLLVVAFVSGMSVMGVELSASRLLAPYYGTSTFVWTNVIGVILIALSLGYWYGGKLADTQPQESLLYKIIIGASLYLCALPFITPFVTSFINTFLLSLTQSPAFTIFVGSALSMILLFFVPIFFLAFVTPFIITLLSKTDSHIGNITGKVFALSTLGSTLGTFSPVLVFIPLIGTRNTILVFALCLLTLGVIGMTRSAFGIFTALFLLPATLLPIPGLTYNTTIIDAGETVYQYYQIADTDDMRYLYINEGSSIYSVLPKSDLLTGHYFDYYLTLPHLIAHDKPLHGLIVGLAGGTISSQLLDVYGNSLTLDGVEIDKTIIDLGYTYFDMAREGLTVIHDDGRMFVRSTENTYDFVVLDMYSNQLYIPFHMITKEFFDELKTILAPDGIVAMNANALDINSPLLHTLTNTLHTSFEYVSVTPSGGPHNFMILASNTPVPLENLLLSSSFPYPHLAETVSTQTQQREYMPNFGIFTDDKTPIEFLTDAMILNAFVR